MLTVLERFLTFFEDALTVNQIEIRSLLAPHVFTWIQFTVYLIQTYAENAINS